MYSFDCNPENINNFLNCFSRELTEIVTLIKEEQKMDEKYAYSYSSLRAYPLIKMKYMNILSVVCPLPTLLIDRITSGLYYEIVNENNFDNCFGQSFQHYVGKILEISNKNNKINYIPESEYYIGRDRKDTIDWIAYDTDSALFVECKTKRLTFMANPS